MNVTVQGEHRHDPAGASAIVGMIEQVRRSSRFEGLDTWLRLESSADGDTVLLLCCVHGSQAVAREQDGQLVALGEPLTVEELDRTEVGAAAVERAAGMLVPDISVATRMRRERYTLEDAADRLRDHAAGLRQGVVRMGQVTPNSSQVHRPSSPASQLCPFGLHPRMPIVILDVEYDLWMEDLNTGRMHYGDHMSASVEELLDGGAVQLAPVRNVAAADAEYVRGGVCLLCGGAVLDSGEHSDLDRHVEAVAAIIGLTGTAGA